MISLAITFGCVKLTRDEFVSRSRVSHGEFGVNAAETDPGPCLGQTLLGLNKQVEKMIVVSHRVFPGGFSCRDRWNSASGDGNGTGAGAAHQEKLRERSRGAQPGEKETQEGPSGSAQLPEGEGSQEMVGLCS